MNIFRYVYRHVRKTNFIILCIVSMLIFFSLIIGNVENVIRSISELDNQLTNNHIGMAFDEKLENSKILELTDKIKENESIILRYYLQTGFDYEVRSEGIFFNDTFNNSYNLLNGRFFTTDDFNNNKKVAVVGKDALKYAKNENDKKYVLRGMDKYEVIGVMGKENLSSRYDNTILYNLDAILNDNENLHNDTWWVDSCKKSKDEIKEIIASINSNHLIHINDQDDKTPNPLKEAIKSSKKLIISFTLIILCVFLTLIRSILYWIESISLEIGVRKNYGATNREIFFEIIKRYIFISIISMGISLVIQISFLKAKFLEFLHYEISYSNLIMSLSFITILGMVFICIAMYNLNKLEINKLLKEV